MKPWQANIKPPKNYLKPKVGALDRPDCTLSLHHVFGYRCKDVRGNLKMVGDRAIYFTAGLTISQSLVDGSQSFFEKHRY